MQGFQFVLLLAICLFSYLTEASNEHTENCVDSLVDWCNKQYYRNVGYSVWTDAETINGQLLYLECVTGKRGTRCTKNGHPWFQCSSTHLAFYNGTMLSTLNASDTEICYAASKISNIRLIVKGKSPIAEDRQKCADSVVGWCNKQNYTNAGISVWTNTETINRRSVHIQCITSKNGTRCTKNGNFWFLCSGNNTTIYKGKMLANNSNAVDYEICYSTSKITNIRWTERNPIKEGRQKCVNDIADWCKKQDYTNSQTTFETSTTTFNGIIENINCITDKTGTKCTKNINPWYSCLSNHAAIYKSTILRKDSLVGADDEICYTASRITTGSLLKSLGNN